MVLLGLAILSVGFGVRAMRSAPAWAARRTKTPAWRHAFAMLPRLIPAALLAVLAPAMSFIFGGRDASYVQMLYVMPSLVVCLVVASVFGAGVTIAHGVCLRQRR